MMMRLIILCLLLPCCSFSQQTIDAERFFEYGLSTYQDNETSTGKEIHFPWIDRYEFRTETRDLDFEKQEYTARITPSTSKIRSAQKALYDEIRTAPDFEGQELYCNQLVSIHRDWLALYIIHESQTILDDLQKIMDDKQFIQEKMAASYEIDPKEILKLKTERSDLAISRSKLITQREYLMNQYGILGSPLDFSDFITIEVLTNLLPNNPSSEMTAPYTDSEIIYKKQLLNREIELESAEEKRIVDFVQLKYNGPHDDLLQERVSVGLGFQLFNSGSKKLKIQELQIEQDALDLKMEREAKQKRLELDALSDKLRSDIQSYRSFQAIMQEEREELQQLATNISRSAGTSPLLLLEIEARHLSLQKEALKKKESLLEDYLRYLQEADKICVPPLINYLSK